MISLTQALRAKEQEVILEHDGKRYRVDLGKMEEKPVVQRFWQNKLRRLRYIVLYSTRAEYTPEHIIQLSQAIIFISDL